MQQDLDQEVRKAVADFFRQAPRRYPLISILIAVLVLIFLLWKVPQWQIADYELSLKDRLHQENENRKTVAQIVGGVFVLVGLYIAWVRSKAMRDQAEVDREQQLTDLYVKAIEQLGSENLQIRLGGIYALERIARESPKDHWPIMEVLTAFVRVNAPWREEVPKAPEDEEETAQETPLPPMEKPTVDIQAVLTVLGRTAIPYAKEGETRSLDLQATHLASADLRGANLQGANLTAANLQEAILEKANLQEAILLEANLQDAILRKANLQRARLWRGNLQGADLSNANLQGAKLSRANLRNADLTEAKIQKASLSGANLQDASLEGTDLQLASLRKAKLRGTGFWGAKLQGANLREAVGLNEANQLDLADWDETTRWPEGFSPPPPLEEEKKEGE